MTLHEERRSRNDLRAFEQWPQAVRGRHGPYADWREAFTAAVNREGDLMDDAFAARFGLTVDRICSVSGRFFPRRAAGSPARIGTRARAAVAGSRH